MKITLVVFSLLCLGALGLGSYEASKHLGRQWRAVPAEFCSLRDALPAP